MSGLQSLKSPMTSTVSTPPMRTVTLTMPSAAGRWLQQPSVVCRFKRKADVPRVEFNDDLVTLDRAGLLNRQADEAKGPSLMTR